MTYEDLPTFTIRGREVRSINMNESMRYLGCPISDWKASRQKGTHQRIEEVRTNIEVILDSNLAINQKLDAIKKFVLPTLDFALITSDVSLVELRSLDQHLRGLINKQIKSSSLPKPFFYLPIKDGGLGIQISEPTNSSARLQHSSN